MAKGMSRQRIEALMFGKGRVRRFTQDSPILPDVWLAYGEDSDQRLDLLLTPWKTDSPAQIANVLRRRLARDRESVRKNVTAKLLGADPVSASIAAHQAGVAAELTFEELIRVVLPMTEWWEDRIARKEWHRQLATKRGRSQLALAMSDPESPPRPRKSGAAESDWIAPDALWITRIAGALALQRRVGDVPDALSSDEPERGEPAWNEVAEAMAALMEDVAEPEDDDPRIYSVTRNREALLAVTRSKLAVKGDAAARLFEIDCSRISWGIVDSGIDATHPAFADPKKKRGSAAARSRVIATYDFTEIRELLDPDAEGNPPGVAKRIRARKTRSGKALKREDLRKRILDARDVDWSELVPYLEVDPAKYEPPEHDHGTHVGGILGANWPKAPGGPMAGICPEIRFYDIRVFDANGESTEFAVMAALQFVRWLNRTNEYVAVHGVNLSFSLEHDVKNYACGRTPVCDEAERLVSSGIVVVAAAGNRGHDSATAGPFMASGNAYHSISITDPGNAEEVITVGATHRYRPHTYGVSYFSSRGPTGDGRSKPDLVAPGEKITGPALRASATTKDGTSQAAPHVSGAAALLMARHPELVGRPARIKQILCATTTDLGRERYFQGAGMLDILRALQSI